MERARTDDFLERGYRMNNKISTTLALDIPIMVEYLDYGSWDVSLAESSPMFCITFETGDQNLGMTEILASIKIFNETGDECETRFSDPVYVGEIDSLDAENLISGNGDYSKIRGLDDCSWGDYLANMIGAAIMIVLLDARIYTP